MVDMTLDYIRPCGKNRVRCCWGEIVHHPSLTSLALVEASQTVYLQAVVWLATFQLPEGEGRLVGIMFTNIQGYTAVP